MESKINIQRVQFAKDYDFKNSLVLAPGDAVSDRDIQTFLSGYDFSKVSCEFFSTRGSDTYVLGYTNRGEDHEVFIKENIRRTILDKHLHQFIKTLTFKVPDMIRVGIVDYWFETGPCLLWSNGENRKLSREAIEKMIRTCGKLSKTKLNPHGLSFYCSAQKEQPENWVMVETSVKSGDYYIPDIDRIKMLIEEGPFLDL